MNARMILLTTLAASAFAAAAAQTTGAASQTVKPSSKASYRQHAVGSLRTKWLLHNPGLPAWIP